jgi:hypothetical protein
MPNLLSSHGQQRLSPSLHCRLHTKFVLVSSPEQHHHCSGPATLRLTEQMLRLTEQMLTCVPLCRHRGQKKIEKQQARVQCLVDAAAELSAKAETGGCPPAEAERAQQEAAWIQKPWLERNLPVSPPPHAAAAAEAPNPRAVTYTMEAFAASGASDMKRESKKMDVLSFKVGYSLDAEYALPDEVRPPRHVLLRATADGRCDSAV